MVISNHTTTPWAMPVDRQWVADPVRERQLQDMEEIRQMANKYKISQVADDITVDSWRISSIGMRLRIKQGQLLPFQHLSTALAGEKVFVFVVVRDQPVTLEDDHLLFPSDTLITQLRLLQE